jgi:hypothetical protein
MPTCLVTLKPPFKICHPCVITSLYYFVSRSCDLCWEHVVISNARRQCCIPQLDGAATWSRSRFCFQQCYLSAEEPEYDRYSVAIDGFLNSLNLSFIVILVMGNPPTAGFYNFFFSLPATGLSRPLGTGRLRLPDFLDFRHHEGGKVVTLTHRPSLPPGVFLVGFYYTEVNYFHFNVLSWICDLSLGNIYFKRKLPSNK